MTGTERKVFQKYYPPDFDPSKIPRAKGQRNRQFVQRVMAPYNMQCNTCHEYIYKGKKFNMRRETAEGEFYLGLKIFRFYFRCPNCLAEITFKTDLENCDYQQEHGATRLFEAFKLYQQEEKAKETRDEEDKKDPMKMLEKRTKMSRAEMEAIGKLEELQELNRRQETFDPDRYLHNVNVAEAEALKKQEEEDEKFIKSIFHRTEDGKIVKRILEDTSEIDVKPKMKLSCPVPKQPFESAQKKLLSKIVVLKTKKSDAEIKQEVKEVKKEELIEDKEKKQIKVEVDESYSLLEQKASNSVEKISVDCDQPSVSKEPHANTSGALQSLADYGSDSSSE